MSIATLGGMTNDKRRGPLDGTTSGTIGGGGPDTGGPTERPQPPDIPRTRPENAAGGRLAPDTIDAATPIEPPPLTIPEE